jgi:hypothetical protein
MPSLWGTHYLECRHCSITIVTFKKNQTLSIYQRRRQFQIKKKEKRREIRKKKCQNKAKA